MNVLSIFYDYHYQSMVKYSGMVYYFVNEFNLLYPVSLVLAVGTAAFSNFIVNKKWTFNEKVWG